MAKPVLQATPVLEDWHRELVQAVERVIGHEHRLLTALSSAATTRGREEEGEEEEGEEEEEEDEEEEGTAAETEQLQELMEEQVRLLWRLPLENDSSCTPADSILNRSNWY